MNMIDETGLLVGRVFFAICSFLSLLAVIYTKRAVDMGYWYIRTFQFKNIVKQPNIHQYRYARFYFWACLIIFVSLAFNPLLMESMPFITVFFMIVSIFTVYFYWSLF